MHMQICIAFYSVILNSSTPGVVVFNNQTCHPVVGTDISGGGGEYYKRYSRGSGEVLQKFGKGGSGILFLENRPGFF